MTNNPSSDKRELIRSLTKALYEPSNDNDDGEGRNNYVFDDNNSQRINHPMK